jgi:hypothetical protein
MSKSSEWWMEEKELRETEEEMNAWIDEERRRPINRLKRLYHRLFPR